MIDGEEVDFGREGIDQVVFLFAPNPGEPPRPLARIASGGELSRIHLALQLASRGEAEKAHPTLVFDEVDTGIGGAEAAALGAKLQRLAKGGQILAVTHLPQVASYGDLHFKVSKTGGRRPDQRAGGGAGGRGPGRRGGPHAGRQEDHRHLPLPRPGADRRLGPQEKVNPHSLTPREVAGRGLSPSLAPEGRI